MYLWVHGWHHSMHILTNLVLFRPLSAAWCPQQGETALYRASNNGHLEVVQALVAAKADLNAKNKVSATWGEKQTNMHAYMICDLSVISAI